MIPGRNRTRATLVGGECSQHWATPATRRQWEKRLRDEPKERLNEQNRIETMASARVVLISGCSSGIGLYTALLLAKDPEKRFKVYATMRNLEKKTALESEGKDYLGETLIVKQMDVSSDESVTSVVDELITKEGKVDVLSKYPA